MKKIISVILAVAAAVAFLPAAAADNTDTRYIKCYFKEPYREFNHDRYIFTEQIGVQFGRGIDLFDENERLRKMTVSIIDNSEKRQLETNVRCLDDIEEQIVLF